MWTVEEYVRYEEVYKQGGKLYLPGLIRGSPACDSYFAGLHVKQALGDARNLADMLAGQGVGRDGDSDYRKAYNHIILCCNEIGGDRKEALLKLRAQVCRYHDLDVSDVGEFELPEFVRLLKAVAKSERTDRFNEQDTPSITTQSAIGPVATWKRKLEFLQIEEAKTTSAAQKFELQEQINEAEAKIRELGE